MKDSGETKVKDKRLYNRNFIQACTNAMNGIVYCATSQTNIRKELIIGTIVMILSLFYNLSTAEFLCLTFAVFFVIFAEFVNTAIETIVDLLVDVYHPKAKIAKDVGAGAVVLSAVNAVIVAYFIFLNGTDISKISNSIFQQMVASPAHLAFVAIILTIIAIIVAKSIAERRKISSGVKETFIPSGQSAIAFAILTAIWINSRNPIIFCLSLILSLLIVGNRMNDKRTLGEVIFGGFMGMLIVFMVYSLILIKFS